MSNTTSSNHIQCDLLVIGSGAGGLSTAITAKKYGLDVIVVEKEAVFGGTTAFSGGVLWIPGNPHAKCNGVKDSREAARTYIRNEIADLVRVCCQAPRHSPEGVALVPPRRSGDQRQCPCRATGQVCARSRHSAAHEHGGARVVDGQRPGHRRGGSR